MQIYRWNQQDLSISLFFFWIWSCKSPCCFFLSRSLLPWRSIPSCSWRRCMEGGGVVSRSGGVVARWKGYRNGDGVGGVVESTEWCIEELKLAKLLSKSDCIRIYRALLMPGMLWRGLNRSRLSSLSLQLPWSSATSPNVNPIFDLSLSSRLLEILSISLQHRILISINSPLNPCNKPKEISSKNFEIWQTYWDDEQWKLALEMPTSL